MKMYDWFVTVSNLTLTPISMYYLAIRRLHTHTVLFGPVKEVGVLMTLSSFESHWNTTSKWDTLGISDLLYFSLNCSATRASQSYLLNGTQNCHFLTCCLSFSWGFYQHEPQILLEPPSSPICCSYLKLNWKVVKILLKSYFKGCLAL